MKKYLFLLFLISISTKSVAQINFGKAPKWVKKTNNQKFDSLENSKLSQGIHYLLVDNQVNLLTQENYSKNSFKIINNSGIQNISTISIKYDPSYQKLSIHKIEIIRNGKTVNKINENNFQSYKTESSAESYIYDGSVTATTHIDDVRVGDILTYSYSLKGFNPIFKNNFSSHFYFSDQIPIALNHLRILSHDKLFVDYINCDFNANIKKTKTYFDYTWRKENSEALVLENNIPIWKLVNEIVSVTTFKNWNETAKWASNIFFIDEPLNKEIIDLSNKINSTNFEESEKVMEVLNFVQDDIRYLGLESGIGAYKPFHPNKVINQRYGDCKDKSLLMVSILREMGIRAYPTLVNTYLGESIHMMLPSSINFNHCVVKVIDKDDRVHWFDPTIANQFGTFYTTYFPDYKYGLVIDDATTKLEKINFHNYSSLTVYDEFSLEKQSEGTTFTSKKIYQGSLADEQRQIFSENSIVNINKAYLEDVSNLYYNVTSLKEVFFEDDKKENTFTTYESYKIDSLWQPSVEVNDKLLASFHPSSIYGNLILPTDNIRKEPFLLFHPVKTEHNIKIKLNNAWDITDQYLSINNKNFFYDFMAKYDSELLEVDISYLYETYSDHVDPSEYPKFGSDMKNLKQNIGYSLVKDNSAKSSISIPLNNNNLYYFISIGIFLWAFVILIWLSLKVIKYDPKPTILSYYSENQNFDIWLVSIIAFLIISVLVSFIVNIEVLASNWVNLLLSNNKSSGLLLFYKGIFSLAHITFTSLSILLFFKKRSSFPRVISIVLIAELTLALIEYLVSLFTNPIIYGSDNRHLIPLLIFIKTVAIVLYLNMNDRPKEIFIKSLNHDQKS
ncbi:DUF3857 domain-containing protein [Flavicella sp.]|uniref:DUF3857 domain-containing protein n=1 Tax=Flavicella sp. TaxID=2957742 RepID=UPI002628ED77|nr:DUF3857 domain-containing protein [Flavicella sp.]MDG1805191.1 DUF3857 domain-containing protein [Flavicella sp.]MDG2279328.1 DUF3857 domain-containing protein [Flavicella sp.]